jgi:hypothetical protein
MSNDDHPPQPGARHVPGPLALFVALLALAGVCLAVIGADTTVGDALGAPPIVDDANRQEPARGEQEPQAATADGPAAPVHEPATTPVRECAAEGQDGRVGAGCSPPSLRGPPAA